MKDVIDWLESNINANCSPPTITGPVDKDDRELYLSSFSVSALNLARVITANKPYPGFFGVFEELRDMIFDPEFRRYQIEEARRTNLANTQELILLTALEAANCFDLTKTYVLDRGKVFSVRPLARTAETVSFVIEAMGVK
jgi:hypothetical protein